MLEKSTSLSLAIRRELDPTRVRPAKREQSPARRLEARRASRFVSPAAVAVSRPQQLVLERPLD